MQELVPSELLGRASSVDELVSFGLSPLGVIFAGILAEAIGVRETLLIGGLVALSTPIALAVPGVRDPERRMQVSQSEVPEEPAGDPV